MNKKAHARAHGKIILIGEHSVVYQYGALVAPFSHDGISVDINHKKGPILIDSFYHQGEFFAPGAPIEGLQALLKHFLDKFQLTAADFEIKITSTLLSRRGLGSSAAVAKALAEALYLYFDLPYQREDLVELIKVSELVYHAKPSGIDMNAVLSDDLLFYQNGKFERLTPRFPLHIVVVDSGKASQTRLSVSEVARRVEAHDEAVIASLARLGDLASLAKEALTSGTLSEFAPLLKESQIHLQTIGVSSEELDTLINSAYQNRALAAKLTGGGQGGCMFALFENSLDAQEFATLIDRQGYQHQWQVTIQ